MMRPFGISRIDMNTIRRNGGCVEKDCVVFGGSLVIVYNNGVRTYRFLFSGYSQRSRRGTKLYEAHKYNEAIPVLTGVAAADPSLACEAELRMTQCYHGQGKIAEAIIAAKTGVGAAVLPKDRETLKLLRQGLAYLCSLTNDWRSVQTQYELLVKENPDESAHWLQELADSYVPQGKYSEAIETIKKGIAAAVFPRDREVVKSLHTDLASQYVATGDWQNAQAEYEKLLAAYPEDAPRCRLELGRAYCNQGKFADGIAVLKKGIESADLSKDTASLKLLKPTLAFYLADNKKWDEAAAIYQQLLSTYPDDKAQWYREQAIFFDKQADYSQAIETAKKGIAAGALPKDKDMLKILKSALPYYYVEAKNWQNAEAMYKVLLEEYPEDSSQWLQELERCYRLQGRDSDADAILSKGVAAVSESTDPALTK